MLCEKGNKLYTSSLYLISSLWSCFTFLIMSHVDIWIEPTGKILDWPLRSKLSIENSIKSESVYPIKSNINVFYSFIFPTLLSEIILLNCTVLLSCQLKIHKCNLWKSIISISLDKLLYVFASLLNCMTHFVSVTTWNPA